MSLLKSSITIKPVVAAFEQLGINYYIGGSVASSAYGIPRTIIDVDIIADLHLEHVQPLVKLLEETYYIDADMIKDVIRSRSEFNVIHYGTMLKVDVFIPKTRAFDESMSIGEQQKRMVACHHPFLLLTYSLSDIWRCPVSLSETRTP